MNIPEHLTEEQQDLFDEFKKHSDYAIFVKSEGGKILKNAIQRDMLSTIDSLSFQHTHEEYLRLSAKLTVLLGLYKAFSKAETNSELAKEALTDSLVG